MKIITNNEYIDQYNFSSLFTESDNQELMRITQDLVAAGDYFTNSPKYQTKQNLFARHEPIFLKMRQSFIYSCFMYLGREVQIRNIMSWVFMTSAKDAEDREKLWHNHHVSDNNSTTSTVSGIWYVHIPQTSNPDISGTEFSISGPPNFNDPFFMKPNNLTWNIYPSKIWHRPGITDSDEYRFVFAADMEYYV